MEKKIKIFISGKITGEVIRECILKFNMAEIDLYTKFGGDIRVVNPLHLKGIHFGIEHSKAMNICYEALEDCTHIFMLEDWKDSEGAGMEHIFAKRNKIKVIYQNNEK